MTNKNAKQKYLTPDGRFNSKTFAEHCSHIPEFYFKKGVPQDVVKNFEIVERLLALSYYEYRFVDEALTKSLHTFEMAMSIRYKDFYPDSGKVTFNKLIIDLTSLGAFETRIEVLRQVKNLRNYYSHPERHSFAGVMQWNKVEFVSRLINEIYEDIELREKRQMSKDNLSQHLTNNNLDKGLVIEIDGQPSILFSIHPLFVNNKLQNATHLFAGVPLFDYSIATDGSWKIPKCFKIKLVSLEITSESITGISFSAKKQVKLTSIHAHPQLFQGYQEWIEGYKKLDKSRQFLFESSIDYNSIYTQEIQEFQRID